MEMVQTRETDSENRELRGSPLSISRSGVLHIVMNDGTEKDVGPGEISLVPTGHDAWVVGNEPVVVVDFQGMVDYARHPRRNRPSKNPSSNTSRFLHIL